MKKRRNLNRRRFLQGAGAALSLPFLESLRARTAHATPNKDPKRLIIVYGTQGLPISQWKPSGTPSQYQLGQIMNFDETIDGKTYNLNDHRDDMAIITGINATSAIDEGGNAHNASAGHMLCGRAMLPGGSASDAKLSGGISVDNHIANHITPADVAYKALHLGVRNNGYEVSFTGAAQPVNRLVDPQEVADALFGGFSNSTPAERARLKAREQSVLDATKEQAAALRARLSGADRHRLDEYLTRVGEIERRLNANFAVGEQCAPIGQLNLQPSPFRDHAPEVNFFHPYYDPDVAAPAIIDCMVEALACDRTRVTTLTIGDNERYHWLKAGNPAEVPGSYLSGNWHNDVVHKYWNEDPDPSLPTSQEKQRLGNFLTRVAQWEHGLFAYLLSKLKSKQEGSGSLLDNCLVLYCNEFGSGTHKHDDMPYIVAGGCGGAIKTGQWLQAPGVHHNRLLLTMMRAFGMQDTSFGDAKYCGGGPLSGLLV